jgi:branched-chain amino acid transport system permease protein
MKNKLSKFYNSESIISIIFFLFLFFSPLFKSEYGVMKSTSITIMVILSLSLTLIWGFTGIFSFSQAIFFGIGGYVYAVCSKLIERPTMTPLYAVIAIGAAMLFAIILGIFMFYGGINDVFVGLITLSISLAMYTFMQTATGDEWKIQGKNGLFDLGGWTGMNGIPRLQVGSFTFNTLAYYYLIAMIILIIFVLFRIIKKSKMGFSMLAIRENRDRSELFGYNVPLIQTIVFSIGAAIAAIAGILYVGNSYTISIDKISITASTMPVILVATAGRKNATGAMIFTFFYYYLDQAFASAGNQYSPIIIGVILIAVVLFLPNGLFDSVFKGLDAFVSKTVMSISKKTE